MSLQELRASAPETRLIRSATGRGVHLRGCPRAGKGWMPWVWAEGREDSEWMSLPWLKPCRYCMEQNTGKSPE